MNIKGTISQNKKTSLLTVQFEFTPDSKTQSNRIFVAVRKAFEKIAKQNGVKVAVRVGKA